MFEIEKSVRNRLGMALYGFLLLLVVTVSSRFAREPIFTDFWYFHYVGQLVPAGQLGNAYYAATFADMLRSMGDPNFVPWSYPPQFGLLVSLLARLPLPVSYVAFVVVTSAAYLACLRILDKENFIYAILAVYPAWVINAMLGHNGFLTGTLIAAASILLLRGGILAGAPLGALIIKPQLALTLALYTVLRRRWGAVAVAVSVIAVTTILSGFALGFGIWSDFQNSLRETWDFLKQGHYPLFHMVSIYASFRTLGGTADASLAAQAIVTICALLSIVAAHGLFDARRTLGVAILAIPLISPYVHNYDTAILAVGLALLIEDMKRLGTRDETATVMLIAFVSSGYGFYRTLEGIGPQQYLSTLSPSGLGFALLYVLVWRILLRGSRTQFTFSAATRGNDLRVNRRIRAAGGSNASSEGRGAHVGPSGQDLIDQRGTCKKLSY